MQFSCSVVSDSLRPHELQHARPPCPSPTPRVHPNPCPLNRWCHPTISFSVIPISSCSQSFPASGSFPVSQLFGSGGQSIGASASAPVLPMNGGGLVTKLCPTLRIPWIVACQTPLSVEFSGQGYWSGLPFPSPRCSDYLSRILSYGETEDLYKFE